MKTNMYVLGGLLMKIAIVSPGLFSVPPVVGTSVEHVINQVAHQLKQHQQVVVYTKKCTQYSKSSQEGNLLYKRIRFKNSQYYLNRVIKHIRQTKPDVIIIENRPSYVIKVKKACPTIPVVLNMHSDVYASTPYMKHDQMIEVSQIVDALITNSKALEKTFVERYSAFQGKSYPIHLGIDTAPYDLAMNDQQSISSLREKFNLVKEEPVILFAGRLLKRKGVHLILEIMPQLIEKYPRLMLIITGSPRYGKNKNTKYLNRINHMTESLREHVIFTDFVNPETMPSIYQLADIVVTPSIWNEPFLLVNLEAMASMKPVVTTNKGGIPEVVKHGETGFVFSVENYRKELFPYISMLLDSQLLRDALSQQGWKRAKEFSWTRTANDYYQVFERLVAETIQTN